MAPIVTDLNAWGEENEHSKSFSTYRNYVEALTRVVTDIYGPVRVRANIDAALSSFPANRGASRFVLDQTTARAVQRSLGRSWGLLRAASMPAEFDDFVPEFNAMIPVAAYYAVFHALHAAIPVVLGHPGPLQHRPLLNDASTLAGRGLLPWPWSAMCSGWPEGAAEQYAGFPATPSGSSNLANLEVDALPDRVAQLLRTTRSNELERRFEEARKKGKRTGRTRKNLSAQYKREAADKMMGTTIFDFLWRIRKKANYEGSDPFVLGAAHNDDASRFGSSLAELADLTVFTLTSLVKSRIGEEPVAGWIDDYLKRSPSAAFLREHRSALISSPF